MRRIWSHAYQAGKCPNPRCHALRTQNAGDSGGAGMLGMQGMRGMQRATNMCFSDFSQNQPSKRMTATRNTSISTILQGMIRSNAPTLITSHIFSISAVPEIVAALKTGNTIDISRNNDNHHAANSAPIMLGMQILTTRRQTPSPRKPNNTRALGVRRPNLLDKYRVFGHPANFAQKILPESLRL